MATPFLPAAMKYSTSSSSECERDVGCLPSRLARAVLRLGRELGRFVDGPPPIAVSSAAASGSSASSAVVAPVDTMIVAGKRRDVAVVREQRAVLAGGDEVDADRVLPRVAARAILDLQLIAVVLLVALHGHGARRRRQRAASTSSSSVVGEVLAIGVALRAALRRSRADGRGARPCCSSFWCAIIRCSSFSSSSPDISVPSASFDDARFDRAA